MIEQPIFDFFAHYYNALGEFCRCSFALSALFIVAHFAIPLSVVVFFCVQSERTIDHPSPYGTTGIDYCPFCGDEVEIK